MFGFRTTVDIAKGALSTSQSSLAVAGHNIANVSTEGFTRQNATPIATTPVTLGGNQYGSGVSIEMVQREVDVLLEKRLTAQRSVQAAADGSIKYVDSLETIFDVQSDNNLNTLMGDFWNSWHDLSNNPSATAERSVVFESGNQMVGQFQNLKSQLLNLKTDIDQEIDTAVGRINNILTRISELNSEINLTEAQAPANDQRDSRNRLVNELAEFISINTIEQPNGFITLMTDNGYPLVIGEEAFHLKVGQGRVSWVNETGNKVDISNQITSGKISGWLDIKEEIIAKSETDLDALAKEIIWQVNSLHSSGAGADYFSTSRSGTYAPKGGLFSALPFGDRIDYTKDFKMWVKDSKNPPTISAIEMDMGKSTASVSDWKGAAAANSKYRVTVAESGTVGPGADNPVITWERLAADGSVQATGANIISNANAMAPATIDGLSFDISAGTLVAGNTFTINTGATGEPAPLQMGHDPAKRANSVLDTYTFEVVSGGGDLATVSRENPMVLKWSSSSDAGTFTLDNAQDLTAEIDGMSLSFDSGTLFDKDVFTLETNNLGFPEDGAGNLQLNNPSDWHWTVSSFANRFNTQATAAGAQVTANVTNLGVLDFTPDPGTSFTFSDDLAEDAGVMAALGINTFFTGQDSGTITVNGLMEDLENIVAAKVEGGERPGIISTLPIADPASVNVAINPLSGNDTLLFEENGTLKSITLDPVTYTTKTDLHSLAAEVESKMNAASTLESPATYRVEYNELENRFKFSENNGSNLKDLNMLWKNTPGTAAVFGFQATNELYIPPNGSYGVSNNTTALDISGVQFNKYDMARWSFSRSGGGFSTTVNVNSGSYFQDILSTLGIKASGIRQASEFNDIMVEKLTELRDSVSGVSVDEEMVKLMAFQQSYVAASKLITTADEMIQSLLAIR